MSGNVVQLFLSDTINPKHKKFYIAARTFSEASMKHPPLTLEYSKITPTIYIGTNMCCQQHFAKSLLRKGIRADLSLEEKRIDSPFGVQYYLWLPVKDHHAPTIPQLEVAVLFLGQLRNKNIKCYLHCERGHGRAPTIMAAYLITEGKSLKQALHMIKVKRPAIHLDSRQVAQLRKWEKRVGTLRK